MTVIWLPNNKKFSNAFSCNALVRVFKAKIVNKRSRGSDGMSATGFEKNLDVHVDSINRKILVGSYKFSPYVELQVSKGRGKAPRILSVPTIRDQVALSALKEHLHAKFSSCVNRKLPTSYIFKLMRFMRDEVHEAEEYGFIRTDVTGFYDNIDRERLMNFVRKKNVSRYGRQLLYRSITTPTVPSGTPQAQHFRFYSSKGIPQGLAISNILADIYMHDFDEKFDNLVLLYMRYVDDILLIFPLSEKAQLLEKIRFATAKLGLSLNESKTEIGVLNRNTFDFLGYRVIAGNSISVRQTSVDRLIQSFANLITSADHHFHRHKDLNPESYRVMLIEDLNEKITGAVSNKKQYGWLYYFSQMNDVPLLHHLDRALDRLCERSFLFTRKRPVELKSFVRAYRKIHAQRKGEVSDYLLSYDGWDLERQLEYIKRHGEWSGTEPLSPVEINALFARVIARRMSRLDADLKSLS